MSLEQILNILSVHKFTFMFYFGAIILLIIYRKKFEFEGIMALYRTTFGINLMKKLSQKHGKLIQLLGIIGIGLGFFGMILSILAVFWTLFIIIRDKMAIEGSPLVLPGVPLDGLGGITFPLLIGILSLLIIMIIHEFSHGIVAKSFGVRIKSTGLALLGPIFGAFVEPDEEELKKKDDIVQNSIYAAGPISNFISFLIIFILLVVCINPLISHMTDNQGVILRAEKDSPAMISGIEEKTIITYVNNESIKNINEFLKQLETLKPNQTVILGTQDATFNITSTKHPRDEERGYLGVIFISENIILREDYKNYNFAYISLLWIKELFFWLFLLSLGVAMFNLYPIYITDGARMLQASLDQRMKDKKKAKRIWSLINKTCLYVIFVMILARFFFLFV
jgi:membrane-associated protease RseP (regulator of RpoE activity)